MNTETLTEVLFVSLSSALCCIKLINANLTEMDKTLSLLEKIKEKLVKK